MFENPIFNGIAMFAGFVWLLLLIYIGFKVAQREYVLWLRRRRAETETAPKGRYSDVQDAIRRAQV